MKTSKYAIVLIISYCMLPLILGFSQKSVVTKRFQSTTSLKASSTQERKPWDFLRFVRQSSKFVSIIPTNTKQVAIKSGDTLWKAGEKKGFTFAPLDDVVMGGASSSTFDETTGIWSGEVTDANNGGFVGIRSTPSISLDMSSCTGIEFKIRSSLQKRMKIGLRDSSDFNGIVWNASIDISNRPSTIKVPFNKLIPTKFARTVSEDERFQSNNVAGIQFVYTKFEYDGALNSKFQLGDVNVQVLEIKAY